MRQTEFQVQRPCLNVKRNPSKARRMFKPSLSPMRCHAQNSISWRAHIEIVDAAMSSRTVRLKHHRLIIPGERGQVYAQQGRYADALAELSKAEGPTLEATSQIGHVYVISGKGLRRSKF